MIQALIPLANCRAGGGAKFRRWSPLKSKNLIWIKIMSRIKIKKPLVLPHNLNRNLNLACG